MAIGKTNAGAGGSGGVNFRVVNGLTQPTSPKENTIWVKTDIDIPYWTTASSNKAPAYGAPKGTVTFWWESATDTEVSGSTAAGFMPIKYKATNPPGNMRLKPYNCYQNQDGTAAGWKSMEAYIYKGGTGVQFSSEMMYLYIDGDECTDITGGWEPKKRRGYANNAESILNFPEVTKNGDSVTLRMVKTGVGSYDVINKIDLSGISRIRVVAQTVIPNSGDQVTVSVLADGDERWGESPAAKLYLGTTDDFTEYSLDVSSITGEKKIVIGLGAWSNNVRTTIKEVECIRG